MSKKTGSGRRFMIAKNLIMLIVIAVTIVLACFSWFMHKSSATASGISIQSRKGGLDVAECVKTYTNIPGTDGYDSDQTAYTLWKDGPGEFTETLNFNDFKLTKDCTGDGVNLIVPEFNVANDYVHVKETGKEVNTNLTPANAVSNYDSDLYKLRNPNSDAPEYDYIQIEFYVRAKSRELLLGAETKLLSDTEYGTSGSNGSSLSTYTDSKKSAYGNFNVDGLVGAMRVSLIGEPCSSITQNWTGTGENIHIDKTAENAPQSVRGSAVRQILWVPRPDVFLKVSEGSAVDNWELLTGINSVTAQYYDRTHVNTYYKSVPNGVKLVSDNDLADSLKSTVSNGTVTIGNGTYATLGTSKNISNFEGTVNPCEGVVIDKNNQANVSDYYITKYTMKIWIEGTDAEARRAMDGGHFHLDLVFT